MQPCMKEWSPLTIAEKINIVQEICLTGWFQVSLGGLHKQQEMKNEARNNNGLPPLHEDPVEVCRQMRASSPPASAADLIEQQQIPRRGFKAGGPKRVSCFFNLVLSSPS